MLTIDLGTQEYYNAELNEFKYDVGGVVRFEYSLKTIYDWEAVWKIPFLKGELNDEQAMDFFMRMALDPIREKFITREVRSKLTDYLGTSHTATTFTEEEGTGRGPAKVHTAEELYALMIIAGVPLEFENRNLNRLLDILKVISIQNSPKKKMDKQQVYKQNSDLNAQRKAALKTKG